MAPPPFSPEILGRWKQFEFQWIKDPSQYPAVLEHLHQNFFLSTPLTQGLEYSQEYFDEFDKIYLTTLPQNLSFAAVDVETNRVIKKKETNILVSKL